MATYQNVSSNCKQFFHQIIIYCHTILIWWPLVVFPEITDRQKNCWFSVRLLLCYGIFTSDFGNFSEMKDEVLLSWRRPVCTHFQESAASESLSLRIVIWATWPNVELSFANSGKTNQVVDTLKHKRGLWNFRMAWSNAEITHHIAIGENYTAFCRQQWMGNYSRKWNWKR